MRVGEYIQTLIRAEKGDPAARERITAALNRGNVTTSPGVVPVTYVQQVIDSLGADRPLFDAVRPCGNARVGHDDPPPRSDRPGPNGGFLADDTAGAPTDPVVIGNQDQPVRQWAWAGAASVALVERSAPAYVEEVFCPGRESLLSRCGSRYRSGIPRRDGRGCIGRHSGRNILAAYRQPPTLLVCGMAAYGKLLDATGIAMLCQRIGGRGGQCHLRRIDGWSAAPTCRWGMPG